MERLYDMWYEWGLNLEHGDTFLYVLQVGFGLRAWRDFPTWYEWGLNLEHGETFRNVVQVGLEPRAWRDFPICGMSGV